MKIGFDFAFAVDKDGGSGGLTFLWNKIVVVKFLISILVGILLVSIIFLRVLGGKILAIFFGIFLLNLMFPGVLLVILMNYCL